MKQFIVLLTVLLLTVPLMALERSASVNNIITIDIDTLGVTQNYVTGVRVYINSELQDANGLTDEANIEAMLSATEPNWAFPNWVSGNNPVTLIHSFQLASANSFFIFFEEAYWDSDTGVEASVQYNPGSTTPAHYIYTENGSLLSFSQDANDYVLPKALIAEIYSDNASEHYVKVGDTITFNLTFTELLLATPSITLMSGGVELTNNVNITHPSGFVYVATVVLNQNDIDDRERIWFRVRFRDTNFNYGTDFTDTEAYDEGNGDWFIFDKSVPAINDVVIETLSEGANPTNGNAVNFDITWEEDAIFDFDSTDIFLLATGQGGDQLLEGEYSFGLDPVRYNEDITNTIVLTMTDTEFDGTVSFAIRDSINGISDSAGNVTYDAIIVADGIDYDYYIDNTFPTVCAAPTFSAVTTSSATVEVAATTDSWYSPAGYYYNFKEEVATRLPLNDYIESGYLELNDINYDVTDYGVNTQHTFVVDVKDYAGNETTGVNTASFYTYANAPTNIVVDNPTATTLDVSWDLNGSPSYTEYSIMSGTDYVQADGTLDTAEFWQPASSWMTVRSDVVVTVLELTPGTEYNFVVTGRNGDDVETSSINGSLYTLALVPTLSSATHPDDTEYYNSSALTVDVSQDAGSASYYKYLFDQTEVPELSAVQAGTQDDATIEETITADGTWFVHVVAYNGDDVSSADYATYTVNYDGTAPTELQVSLDEIQVNQVTVSGSANFDIAGANEAAPYNFYDGSSESGFVAATNTFTDLSENTQYTFQMKGKDAAIDPNINSEWGGDASAYTLLSDLGEGDFAATATIDGFVMEVSQIPNGTEGMSGYAYWYNTEFSGWTTANIDTLTSMLPNQHVEVGVKTRNGDGVETTPYYEYNYTLAEAPGASVLDNALATTFEISYSTGTNSTDPEAVIRVEDLTDNSVYYITDVVRAYELTDTETWLDLGADPAITLTGLTSNTHYQVDIKFRNGDNIETIWSETDDIWTTLYTPVVALPDNSTDSWYGSNEVTVNISQSEGTAADSYTFWVTTTIPGNVTVQDVLDNGVDVETTYQWAVADTQVFDLAGTEITEDGVWYLYAVGFNGGGIATGEYGYTYINYDGTAPTEVTVTAEPGVDVIYFTGASANFDLSGPNAGGRFLYYANGADSWVDVTDYDFEGRTENTEYLVTVTAKDNTIPAATAYAAYDTVYTLAGEPTNLVMTDHNASSLTVSVDAFTNDQLGSSGYHFEIVGITDTTITTNTYTFENLEANTEYTIYASYFNQEGVETGTINISGYTNMLIAGTPVLTNPTTSGMDVYFDSYDMSRSQEDGLFAIEFMPNIGRPLAGGFVQADLTIAPDTLWQTYDQWFGGLTDPISITGLTYYIEYLCKVYTKDTYDTILMSGTDLLWTLPLTVGEVSSDIYINSTDWFNYPDFDIDAAMPDGHPTVAGYKFLVNQVELTDAATVDFEGESDIDGIDYQYSFEIDDTGVWFAHAIAYNPDGNYSPEVQTLALQYDHTVPEVEYSAYANDPGDITAGVTYSSDNQAGMNETPFYHNYYELPAGDIRELGTQSIVPYGRGYDAGTTFNMHFLLAHPHFYSDGNEEYVVGAILDFPEGITVNYAESIMEDYYDESEILYYNGETGNGARISWGDTTLVNYNYAISTNEMITVNVTVDSLLTGDVQIGWEIFGDGWDEPQQTSSSGNFLVGESTDEWTTDVSVNYPSLEENKHYVFFGETRDDAIIPNIGGFEPYEVFSELSDPTGENVTDYTQTSISVEVDAFNNDGYLYSEYYYQIWQDGSMIDDDYVSDNTYTFENLTENEEYTIYISYIDAEGNETGSVSLTQWTGMYAAATPTLSNPTTVGMDVYFESYEMTRIQEEGLFAIEFTPNIRDISSGFVQADLSVAPDTVWQSYTQWFGESTDPITITGLDYYTEYICKVYTKDNYGVVAVSGTDILWTLPLDVNAVSSDTHSESTVWYSATELDLDAEMPELHPAVSSYKFLVNQDEETNAATVDEFGTEDSDGIDYVHTFSNDDDGEWYVHAIAYNPDGNYSEGVQTLLVKFDNDTPSYVEFSVTSVGTDSIGVEVTGAADELAGLNTEGAYLFEEAEVRIVLGDVSMSYTGSPYSAGTTAVELTFSVSASGYIANDISSIQLDFPAGINITGATSFGTMPYNSGTGDGATILWTGGTITSGSVTVYADIDAGLSGLAPVSWQTWGTYANDSGTVYITEGTPAGPNWQSESVYSFTDLAENTLYTYQATIRDNAVEPNEIVTDPTVSVYTLCEAPTGLVIDSQTSSSITASVDAFTNDTAGSSGYHWVIFDTENGNEEVANTTTASNTNLFEGLSPNVHYYVEVSYYNGDEVETTTTGIDAWTEMVVAGAPTLSNPTINSLDVSFAAQSRAQADGDFAIIVTHGGGEEFVQADGSLSATDFYQSFAEWNNGVVSMTPLDYYTEYTVLIRTRDHIDRSPVESTHDTGTAVMWTLPQDVDNIESSHAEVDVYYNDATVDFTFHMLTEHPAPYGFYYGVNRNETAVMDDLTEEVIGDSVVTDYALGEDPDGDWYVHVVAINPDSASSAGITSRIFKVDTTVPTYESFNVTTEATTDSSITVEVTGAADELAGLNTEGAYLFEEYGVLRAVRDIGPTWQSEAFYTFEGLIENTQYTYFSTIRDNAVLPNETETTTASTYTLCEPPTGLVVDGTVTDTSIPVSIDTFTNDSTENSGYRFVIYNDNDEEVYDTERLTENNYEFTDLAPNVEYTIYGSYFNADEVETEQISIAVWTNMGIAGTPVLSNPTTTSMDVDFTALAAVRGQEDGNFGIVVTYTDSVLHTKYVQSADGTLGDVIDYQNFAGWNNGSITMTGLTRYMEYGVLIRTMDHVRATHDSGADSLYTLPSDVFEVSSDTHITSTVWYNATEMDVDAAMPAGHPVVDNYKFYASQNATETAATVDASGSSDADGIDFIHTFGDDDDGTWYIHAIAYNPDGGYSEGVQTMTVLFDNDAPTYTSIVVTDTTSTSLTITVTGASDANAGLNEMAYVYYDGMVVREPSWTTDTSWTFTDLEPNSSHDLYVGLRDDATNPNETLAGPFTARTMAVTPAAPEYSDYGAAWIDLQWNLEGPNFVVDSLANESGTEYALYEVNTGMYLDANDELGSATPVWFAVTGTYEVGVLDLTPETAYEFKLMARNDDGIETEMSTSLNISTRAPYPTVALIHLEQNGIELTPGSEDLTVGELFDIIFGVYEIDKYDQEVVCYNFDYYTFFQTNYPNNLVTNAWLLFFIDGVAEINNAYVNTELDDLSIYMYLWDREEDDDYLFEYGPLVIGPAEIDEPSSAMVIDNPNDQGGYIRLSYELSENDPFYEPAAIAPYVDYYVLEREIEGGLVRDLPSTWELVAQILPYNPTSGNWANVLVEVPASDSLFNYRLSAVYNAEPYGRTSGDEPVVIYADDIVMTRDGYSSEFVPCGSANAADNIGGYADITVYLEGAYNSATGLMSSSLELPLESPYNGQIIDALPEIAGHSLIDWVWVELRNNASGETVNSCNAFLLDDGSLVDVNGNSTLPFYYTTNKDYYLVISHRNHISVMTNESYEFGDFSAEAPVINLSSTNLAVYGGGIKNIGGVYAMYAGDVIADNFIAPTDINTWMTNFNASGYNAADIDLDNLVGPTDVNFWALNYAKYGTVPNSSRTDQGLSSFSSQISNKKFKIHYGFSNQELVEYENGDVYYEFDLIANADKVSRFLSGQVLIGYNTDIFSTMVNECGNVDVYGSTLTTNEIDEPGPVPAMNAYSITSADYDKGILAAGSIWNPAAVNMLSIENANLITQVSEDYLHIALKCNVIPETEENLVWFVENDLLEGQQTYLDNENNWQSFSGIVYDANGLSIAEPDPQTSTVTQIKGVYPNPFNPTTTLYFEIGESSPVSLEIYNIKGQKVKDINLGELTSGSHNVTWNGTNGSGESCGSGVYFFRLNTGSKTEMTRVLMLK